jgi:hypothetical protein
MAAFDFPSAPTVGQKWPQPAVGGMPVYTWDGEKWTTIGAPTGGKTPVYTDGSTPMAAALTLSGPPVAPTDAADKAYADNAAFPSGTVMLFYQASAPTGWTKLTTQNDKALRVVSGNGGVAGGTNSFSSVMAQTVVGNHTLTVGEIPANIASQANNAIQVYPGGATTAMFPFVNGGGANWGQVQVSPTGGIYYASYTGVNGAINQIQYCAGGNNIGVNSSNTGGGGHNHSITMAIQYIDVILASKN